jgi:hypothetical protein
MMVLAIEARQVSLRWVGPPLVRSCRTGRHDFNSIS